MCLPCARTAMHSALSPPYTRSLWAQPLGGVGVWRYWAMEGRASGWCSSRVAASAPVGRVGALFRFARQPDGRQRVVARCVGWGLLWDWAIEFRRGVGRHRHRSAGLALALARQPDGRQRVVARCVGWGLLWDWAIEFRRGVGYPQAMLNDPPGSPPQ